jgi:hypothetical protein
VNDGLDEFDLKLLDAIQHNNRLTAAQLAESVCLSPSRYGAAFIDCADAK